MSKFKIVIEETIVQEFEIEAKNEQDALVLAQQKYDECELVLDQADVQHKQIAVVTDKGCSEWVEF